MKNKKKAFTLVELLAVIVILAVILVIAIPQIMNTIKTARISSFKDSAMLIAEQAEKDFLSQQVLNKDYNETSIPCTDVAKLNDDYDSCTITYNNGIATVTLKGKDGGKFSGITCKGTKDNMNCNVTLEYVYAIEMPAYVNLYRVTNKDLCKNFIIRDLFGYTINDTIDENDNIVVNNICSNSDNIFEDANEVYSTSQWFNNAIENEEFMYEDIREFVDVSKELRNLPLDNYTELRNNHNEQPNLFMRWPNNVEEFTTDNVEICVLYKGNSNEDVNCFKNNDFMNQKSKFKSVFGAENCNEVSNNIMCSVNTEIVLNPCDCKMKLSCGIEETGNINCNISNGSCMACIEEIYQLDNSIYYSLR